MEESRDIICHNLNDLNKAAELLLTSCPENSIFAFYGEMGVGKTTFIKEICTLMNVMDDVSSPTFNIINEYHMQDGKKVYHMDFYRIRSITEVLDIGYEEYFYSGDYCLIEWPEKVEHLLPKDTVVVEMTEEPADHSRMIQIQAHKI
mgnify:CR=1 FL=1